MDYAALLIGISFLGHVRGGIHSNWTFLLLIVTLACFVRGGVAGVKVAAASQSRGKVRLGSGSLYPHGVRSGVEVDPVASPVYLQEQTERHPSDRAARGQLATSSPYSTTSSARNSKSAGIAMPSSLATFVLMRR